MNWYCGDDLMKFLRVQWMGGISKFVAGLISSLFGLALLISSNNAVLALDGGHPLQVFKVEADFDDARFDLESAIVNAGLKVVYNGSVGDMLGRTADDVGAKKTIYEKAEFFTFCSAPNSHATMGSDPMNIVFCPYLLYVYQLAGDKGVSYIGYRRPVAVGSEASKKTLLALDKFLEKLVKEAVE